MLYARATAVEGEVASGSSPPKELLYARAMAEEVEVASGQLTR